MTFQEKLDNIIQQNNSLLCIGLDVDLEKFPAHLPKITDAIFTFNKTIIDTTHDIVCAYKPNIAFYEARGIEGLIELKKTIDYLKEVYPEIPIILDAKRADIANTSKAWAKAAFDDLDVDAITVNPYLGFDALEPFLEYKEKGVIVLCKTSNKSSTDFQDLPVYSLGESDVALDKPGSSQTIPLYMHVARKIVEWDKKYGNCLMVVGATWPEQLKKIRKLTPDMFFLIPGIGAQEGDIQQVLQNGLTANKSGLIMNASRAIIYASHGKDFAQKAREQAQKLRDTINKYR